jgi:hypothetical protein
MTITSFESLGTIGTAAQSRKTQKLLVDFRYTLGEAYVVFAAARGAPRHPASSPNPGVTVGSARVARSRRYRDGLVRGFVTSERVTQYLPSPGND